MSKPTTKVPEDYSAKTFRRIIQDLRNADQLIENLVPRNLFSDNISTAGLTLTKTDTNKIYSNAGATARVDFSLPAVAPDLMFGFCCLDADGIRATAAGSDVIYLGTNVCAGGGFWQSVNIGSLLIIRGFSTAWVATMIQGIWSDV